MVQVIGRDAELGRITRALSQVSTGGDELNVVGPAGIGKSVLLRAAADHARVAGMLVVRAACSQSEKHLGFAMLHQLLRPLLPGLDQLPSGHASALSTAFGMDRGTVGADPFHVALAALELLADAAAYQPLLAIIDDIHWGDQPSLDAIGFIGRRVNAEPIVLLTASRPDPRTAVADSAIVLGPLSNEASSQLLSAHSPHLSAQNRARVLALASGNPLALRELPKVRLHPEAGSFTTENSVLTGRLERAFGDRVAQLSTEAQLALLVAALQDGDSLSETIQAAQLLVANPLSALAEAVAAQAIVMTGNTLQFDHPLIRSAVIRSGNPLSRTQVHAAFARSLVERSPARATWHQAAARSDPDDNLAAELELNAEAVYVAGRAPAAVPWLMRAAELSNGAVLRGRRLLRAAEISFEIGDHHSVAALTAEARMLELDPPDLARLAGLDSAFDDGVPGDARSVQRLTEAAGTARAGDQPDLAASLLVIAARSQYWRGAPWEQSNPIRTELSALPLSIDDPRVLNTTALLDPYRRGALIAEQLRLWSSREPEPALATLLALSAFVAGEFDDALMFARSAVSGLRREGRIALLAQALVLETFAALYLGRWDITFTASHEALQFARETDQPMWAACAMLGTGNVAALRGDQRTAAEVAAQVENIGYVVSNAALINGVQLLRGLTALGRGDSQAAFDQLRRMFDPTDRAYHSPQCVWAVDYFAEAARGCGRLEEGRMVVAAMERLALDTPALGIRRALALARAWLADDAGADLAFAAAERLGPMSPAWYRARLDLAKGMWLRRQQRIAAARLPLNSAQTSFAAMGASAWSDRAGQELAAAGQHHANTTKVVWSSLSAQELLIAQLAARGFTNREIGSQLYLSHRTVGSHLYRIFPKLGLRSRAQLADALRDLGE